MEKVEIVYEKPNNERAYIHIVDKNSYIVWVKGTGYGYGLMSDALEFLEGNSLGWKIIGIKTTNIKEFL